MLGRPLTVVAVIAMVGGLSLPVSAGDVFVPGYTKNNGTYVAPYFRSAPDSSYNNNWSTYPNYNPYTGQQGTHQPKLFDYPAPTYQAPALTPSIPQTYNMYRR